MYVPEAFKETRLEVLHAFMRANPFATLVVCAGAVPVAIHLPILLHSELGPHGILHAHAARANHDVPISPSGIPALFVFQGPNAYISPSWFPSKLLHGRVVPSWNYIAIHAAGLLKTHHEPDWLLSHLEQLSHSQENQREHPWALSDAPKEYIDALAGNVVGIEFEITRLTGKWKLSQNRPVGDQAGVIEGLKTENEAGAQAIALLMQQHLDALDKTQ